MPWWRTATEAETVAGFDEHGNPVAGTTTSDAVHTLFGDLLLDDGPVSEPTLAALIARCESNGWMGWKATWNFWRSSGLI